MSESTTVLADGIPTEEWEDIPDIPEHHSDLAIAVVRIENIHHEFMRELYEAGLGSKHGQAISARAFAAMERSRGIAFTAGLLAVAAIRQIGFWKFLWLLLRGK